jgi:nitrate/nitrite transporter NarK
MIASKPDQNAAAILVALVLWILFVVGVGAWWTFRTAESRKKSRKGVALFLLSLAGFCGALRLAEGLGATELPQDPQSQTWLLLSSVVFAFLGFLLWQRGRDRQG